MSLFTIDTPNGPRRIGKGHPTFIIAELSGNHNQDYDRAIQLIDAAIEAKVDAIKLQTYTPHTMTIDCKNDFFQVQVNENWAGKTLFQLYEEAHTPWKWQPKLKEYAESKGTLLFSSPFDATSVDFLEKMDVSLYKVASFEVVDIPLLEKIGATKKPVIMSRGMSSIEEITFAIQTLKNAGTPQIALLHCVSSYPAKAEQMNLATIADLAQRFQVVAGLSDHTLGTNISIASVALGAHVIEKHFTLKRSDGGPDASFSLEPNELKELVSTIRETEQAIGQVNYQVGAKEAENKVFRKSIFVVQDVQLGEKLTNKNIRVIRPGYGLPPRHLNQVLGRTSKQKITRGTPLSWALLQEET